MKKPKRALKAFVLLVFLLVLFRGWIFRNSTSYSKIDEREEINLKDEKLIKELNVESEAINLEKSDLFESNLNYTKFKERKGIKLTDKELLSEIELEKGKVQLSIEEIINIAKEKTNQKLSFTTDKSSRNPNEVLKTGKANCIGYSALFNSIVNYLIKNQKLERKFKANHLVGKIKFMGVDLHQFSESSFLKDHDYNEIINLETGKKIYVDPTLSDYLKINQVTAKTK